MFLQKVVRTLLHTSRSPRRGKTSRGQALVEFALFVPLLLTLVLGATDVATLLDDHLDIVYAARAGARVGSVIGNFSPSGATFTADCAVIGAVQAALSSAVNLQITQIAIYQAPPSGAWSSTLPQDVYPGNTICLPSGAPSNTATTATWIPSTRNHTPFTEDSIGVAIWFSYTYQFNIFGFLPVAPVMPEYAVMPIEIVVSAP
ncbi:MAG: pilus assembly protein [Chloroflexota bacterium]|nr:pilus assembly protein [Chloroflexota bacterium]